MEHFQRMILADNMLEPCMRLCIAPSQLRRARIQPTQPHAWPRRHACNYLSRPRLRRFSGISAMHASQAGSGDGGAQFRCVYVLFT
jgi:hypothetical protein